MDSITRGTRHCHTIHISSCKPDLLGYLYTAGIIHLCRDGYVGQRGVLYNDGLVCALCSPLPSLHIILYEFFIAQCSYRHMHAWYNK